MLLHPHPDMGGDRFNHVVESLFRGLPPQGISAGRFDFTSGDPVAAAHQVEEAVSQTRPAGLVVVVGYSFGADVAATAIDDRVRGWFLIAPPLRVVSTAAMVIGDDPRPKQLLVPEHDQFSPPARARRLTAGWAATAVTVAPGADHFLMGHSDAVVTAVAGWISGLR